MRLSGECNFCGMCCIGGPYTRCENLIVMGELGNADATFCSAYEARYDGMPIRMVDRKGRTRAITVCHKDCDMETKAIIGKGFGHGCSLRADP